jgi:hypothetical protein
MSEEATKFVIRSHDLLEQLGLHKDKVRMARKTLLTRGVHWQRIGRVVYFTDLAARIMLEHFLRDLPIPEPRKVEVMEVLIVEVTKADFPNRRVVQVKHADGNNHKFLVRVHDSVNFVPGMRFKVRIEAPGEMPIIMGRCPRYRGRW